MACAGAGRRIIAPVRAISVDVFAPKPAYGAAQTAPPSAPRADGRAPGPEDARSTPPHGRCTRARLATHPKDARTNASRRDRDAARAAPMSTAATTRLRRDYAGIKKEPPPYITAAPLEHNILEWCVGRGTPLPDKGSRRTRRLTACGCGGRAARPGPAGAMSLSGRPTRRTRAACTRASSSSPASSRSSRPAST